MLLQKGTVWGVLHRDRAVWRRGRLKEISQGRRTKKKNVTEQKAHKDVTIY